MRYEELTIEGRNAVLEAFRSGKTIDKLVKPSGSAVDALSGLLKGKLPEELDAKALREERLARYAVDD